MKTLRLVFVIVCLIFAGESRSFAQECEEGLDPFECNDMDTPLDEGVVLLVLAGAAFAIMADRKRSTRLVDSSNNG